MYDGQITLYIGETLEQACGVGETQVAGCVRYLSVLPEEDASDSTISLPQCGRTRIPSVPMSQCPPIRPYYPGVSHLHDVHTMVRRVHLLAYIEHINVVPYV
jgi:hypothetical protein